jgi:NAD(P)-dependent dehydrogenase (short-subunit alcohol dehydrogenase family)
VVIAHGRNQERLDALVREVPKSATMFPFRADFASFDEVRAFAREVAADFPRIDVLLNNAGVGSGADRTKREESRDGYELRLAVNYLAPFVLTNQLLPTLRGSASARIVNVASVGQQPFDFDDPMLTGYSLSTLEEGVAATLRLIEAPDLEGTGGRYYDGMREARAKPPRTTQRRAANFGSSPNLSCAIAHEAKRRPAQRMLRGLLGHTCGRRDSNPQPTSS